MPCTSPSARWISVPGWIRRAAAEKGELTTTIAPTIAANTTLDRCPVAIVSPVCWLAACLRTLFSTTDQHPAAAFVAHLQQQPGGSFAPGPRTTAPGLSTVDEAGDVPARLTAVGGQRTFLPGHLGGRDTVAAPGQAPPPHGWPLCGWRLTQAATEESDM